MDFEILRKQMVENQIIRRGIKDERVLSAFLKIPRHEFVDLDISKSAYEDRPLPIGSSQTISQPYIVALMTELLDLDNSMKVLELGTGSGYQTAILSVLAREVYSVERIPALAEKAKSNLESLNINNVNIKVADGSIGLDEFKPYDAIIVTAAAPRIPDQLIEQLNDPGKLVIPVGDRFSQTLMCLEKKNGQIIQTKSCSCVFVPLLGKQGWSIEND